MVELRWIKMFLFLILGLQFTAVTGQYLISITVRDGDEATLSCKTVMTDQDKCDRTNWKFVDSTNTAAVELIQFGQIGEKAKAKSDRLSVTADCSLVIKKVTVEDVGRYTCRQKDRSGQQQGPGSLVYLSVVSMTEHKDSDKVKLSCSVSTYGWCLHTVQWVYEGNDKDVNTQHMNEPQSSCSDTLEFITSHLTELFKCNVTDKRTGKVQLFTVSPPSSGWLRFLIVSVGLTALIIIVMSVNIWTRTKGNKTQISDDAVHDYEDGDEATVIYESIGEPSVSIRLH